MAPVTLDSQARVSRRCECLRASVLLLNFHSRGPFRAAMVHHDDRGAGTDAVSTPASFRQAPQDSLNRALFVLGHGFAHGAAGALASAALVFGAVSIAETRQLITPSRSQRYGLPLGTGIFVACFCVKHGVAGALLTIEASSSTSHQVPIVALPMIAEPYRGPAEWVAQSDAPVVGFVRKPQ